MSDAIKVETARGTRVMPLLLRMQMASQLCQMAALSNGMIVLLRVLMSLLWRRSKHQH